MTDPRLENIKAVIFDLDETLLDAQKGLKAAQKATAERISKNFPKLRNKLGKNRLVEELSKFDDKMNRERKYERDEWWPLFLKMSGFDGDLDESMIRELTETYWDNYIDSATPFPLASSVLEYLDEKGYLLGLLTDTDGSDISKRNRIRPLDLSKFFEATIVGGEDTAESKPSTKCFQLIARELGVEPENCCMVGDKPFTDIKGANSVGMKTILIRRREWKTTEEPNFQIRKLKEIKNLL